MKPPLLFATLSLILASPAAFGKSELEILRSRCSEQERQIHLLEEENAKLRTDGHERSSAVPKTPPAATAAPKAEAASKTPSSATYTIQSGDNWQKISRKLGSTPEKLAKANGLKTSSIIHPGQKLKVPGAAAIAASATPASAPPVAKSGKTHEVREGETFASISKKHGMSTQALIAANPKVKPSALRPGQIVSLGGTAPKTTMIAATETPVAESTKSLPAAKTSMTHQNIPVSTAETFATKPAPSAKPAPTPKPYPTPKPAPTPKPSSTPKPAAATAPVDSNTTPAPANQPVAETETPSSANKIHPVTINGEITYGEFAIQHGTDTARLNALNGLDLTTATVLAKGSELYVPAQP